MKHSRKPQFCNSTARCLSTYMYLVWFKNYYKRSTVCGLGLISINKNYVYGWVEYIFILGNFYIQCILQKLYTFLKKYDIKTLKVEFEIFKNLQSVNEFIKLTFEYHYTLFMIKKRFSVCHFKSFQNAICIIYFW